MDDSRSSGQPKSWRPRLDIPGLLAATDQADDGPQRDTDLDGPFPKLSHLDTPLEAARPTTRVPLALRRPIARGLPFVHKVSVRHSQDKAVTRPTLLGVGNPVISGPTGGLGAPAVTAGGNRQMFWRQRSRRRRRAGASAREGAAGQAARRGRLASAVRASCGTPSRYDDGVGLRRLDARPRRDDPDQVQRVAGRQADELSAAFFPARRAQRVDGVGRGELLADEAADQAARRAARRSSPGGGRCGPDRARPARALRAPGDRGTRRHIS